MQTDLCRMQTKWGQMRSWLQANSKRQNDGAEKLGTTDNETEDGRGTTAEKGGTMKRTTENGELCNEGDGDHSGIRQEIFYRLKKII
jgi:hypothetical protein